MCKNMRFFYDICSAKTSNPMDQLKNFTELIARFSAMSDKKRVVVVCPADAPTISVIGRCLHKSLCSFELVATPEHLEIAEKMQTLYPDMVNVHIAEDIPSAAKLGVKLIHDGKGDVLMKGRINTDQLLKAVLDKECGLLPKGNVMSHISIAQIPGYHKLLMFSDSTVIPQPNLEQYKAIIKYDVSLLHKLGVACPKVALIHFTEKVNPKFPHTLDYVELKKLASEGEFGEVEIDGPMDAKTACDAHSAKIKGIESNVAGDADLLILPDLEAGNVFYKTISLFAHAEMAGLLTGTRVPVVVPSRADSDASKFNSLALACLSV